MSWIWTLVWFAVLALAALVEWRTVRLWAIWAMPGAFVAMLLSIFNLPWWIGVCAFAALTLVGILLRPVAKARLSKSAPKEFTVDQLIGEKCTVTSRIENLAGNGEVKAGGLYWAARAAVEDQIFEVGDTVTVIAVEGVKLICK